MRGRFETCRPIERRRPYSGAVRARTKIALVGLLAVGIGLPVVAMGPPDTIDRPVTATRVAERVTPVAVDVVTIFNSGVLKDEVAAGAEAAARAAGASLAFGRSASVPMTGLYRGAAAVQLPPLGFAYPMGTTVLPRDAIARTMGNDVAQNLTPDALVMGEVSAGLRGAQAGDTVLLTASSGTTVSFRVAAVLPANRVGGAEFLMSPEAGERLGITELRRVVIWGFSSRAAIDSALAANGLVSTSVRIRRSWDPPDPDDTIGMAETKARLGEFAYRVNANGSVSQDDAWTAASLPGGRVLLNDSIPVRARCHNVVEPALARGARRDRRARVGGHDRCHQRQHVRRLPPRPIQPADARQQPRVPLPALLGNGARHQHRRILPGVRSARLRHHAGRLHGRPGLPQARLRVGRQLPDAGRHALRVRR